MGYNYNCSNKLLRDTIKVNQQLIFSQNLILFLISLLVSFRIQFLIMLSFIYSNLIVQYLLEGGNNNSETKKKKMLMLHASFARFSDTELLFAGIYASLRLIEDANNYFGNIFPCANCTSVYSKKSSLITHLKYECGQPPRFKCPYCNLLSKKTSNIQQHIRRKHKDRKVYVEDTRPSSNFQYNARLLCRLWQ